MPTNFRRNANWPRAFDTPGGMVGRHLKKEARKVVIVAKALAGKDTGQLARSIKAGSVVSTPLGPSIEVTASAPHAYYHHEGTRPHAYAVQTRRRGMVIIKHPGTRPNKYLVGALRIVIKRGSGR